MSSGNDTEGVEDSGLSRHYDAIIEEIARLTMMYESCPRSSSKFGPIELAYTIMERQLHDLAMSSEQRNALDDLILRRIQEIQASEKEPMGSGEECEEKIRTRERAELGFDSALRKILDKTSTSQDETEEIIEWVKSLKKLPAIDRLIVFGPVLTDKNWGNESRFNLAVVSTAFQGHPFSERSTLLAPSISIPKVISLLCLTDSEFKSGNFSLGSTETVYNSTPSNS